MKDLQALIKEVKSYQKTKKVWRSKPGSNEFKAANKLNKHFFSQNLIGSQNCQCLEDLYEYINHLSNQSINLKHSKMTQKFKLKAGKVITLHNLNEELTNANLTDDKAIDMLSKYPKNISQFEVYPDNWKELCQVQHDATAVSKKTVPADEIEFLGTKEEYLEMLESKKKPLLVAMCDGVYPEEEWNTLTLKPLAKYLTDKKFPAEPVTESGE